MSDNSQGFNQRAVAFYVSESYPCGYLPDLQARSQIVIPSGAVDRSLYSQLVLQGFRRGGLYIYRPHCDGCRACIPVRIPVDQFKPNRSQRRTWQRNAHLTGRQLPLRYDERHYELYHRYQVSRHDGSSMAQDNAVQYSEFILHSTVESWLLEFSDGESLKIVSLIDVLDDGLSAVYAFFDPDDPHSGLGVYNVLALIDIAKRLELPYVYLGYWISNCRKMSYKANYQPLEALIDDEWRLLMPDLVLSENLK